MQPDIIIRPYKTSDASALADIYYHTIHIINSRDYTEDQINAWAPPPELDSWLKKWSSLPPLVAVMGDNIVGFAEFASHGYIDCFYVHHDFQGKGVGKALMLAIKKEAKKQNILRVYADVSITAKPFFEKQGFHVVRKQEVNFRDIKFINYKMEMYNQNSSCLIRRLAEHDISVIVDAFLHSDWTLKSKELLEKYLLEQQSNQRIVLVAFDHSRFAGYVTLVWESQYPFFYEKHIPEIMDLNVLPHFRNKGIATKLLLSAEAIAKEKSAVVGLGVGLYAGPDGGYGAAQRLYVKMGYVPDGKGVTYCYKYPSPGDTVVLDDDLVLWFVKSL